MKCVRDFGRPSQELASVEFRDDGKYELTCSNGHETTTLLQQQRFELLFDIGAHAILDGYYREAVSSFAASLERFYEFAIRVFLNNAGTPENVVTACWKTVSNQSERQLGAFVLIWASKFHAKPKLLEPNQVTFRNEVVHKGKIPSREEALYFGNSALDVLRQNMLQVRDQLPDSVGQVIIQHLRNCQANNSQHHSSTLCASTIVSLSAGDALHHEGDLEHQLGKLKTLRSLVRGGNA